MTPGPEGTPELAHRAGDFRLRMSAIVREFSDALDMTCDRYGRTVLPDAAAAAAARRDLAAVRAYSTLLAPHTDALLVAARRALDGLPPARHLLGWQRVLDSLAGSAEAIRRALEQPAAPGSADERAQHRALWPHLTAWAANGSIAESLAATGSQQPHHTVLLAQEEQQAWAERVRAARRRGELELTESWYAADGQPITLAQVIEDDASTLVALRGDPDAPGWQVIGHYAHEYEAGQALPAPVPPGVLRPGVSEFNRPAVQPERPVQESIRDLVEAQHAGDASNVLLDAVQHGRGAGPLAYLQELLETGAQFAAALETVQGRQVGARLSALGRQLEFLAREVQDAAEDLGATVAVLPPHRTAVPRTTARPTVSAPVPAPPRTPTAARHH